MRLRLHLLFSFLPEDEDDDDETTSSRRLNSTKSRASVHRPNPIRGHEIVTIESANERKLPESRNECWTSNGNTEPRNRVILSGRDRDVGKGDDDHDDDRTTDGTKDRPSSSREDVEDEEDTTRGWSSWTAVAGVGGGRRRRRRRV
jgi:hypothetical protein